MRCNIVYLEHTCHSLMYCCHETATILAQGLIIVLIGGKLPLLILCCCTIVVIYSNDS